MDAPDAGVGLLDGIVMPEMASADLGLEAAALGVGNDFFIPEPHLLTVAPSLNQSTRQTSTRIPPATNTKSPSIPGTSTFSLHPSPTSSSPSSSSRKRKQSSDEDDESSAAALKRQRNTLAARKYRQKRLDRISELENALEAMKGERDDMRLKLARREAEVDALREILGKR
ncbi:hypothetical protein FZEAL_7890 [Fusarium zealandicum]|uniref:BZIP domain-containing protein n=1 Tax=Fusarium zealandicum TaxID=1053134 RepID=A0A8H4UFP6_9HYPO|nr:hypothetical protein FZEAL_7890 [Fusarium zealandicum]